MLEEVWGGEGVVATDWRGVLSAYVALVRRSVGDLLRQSSVSSLLPTSLFSMKNDDCALN